MKRRELRMRAGLSAWLAFAAFLAARSADVAGWPRPGEVVSGFAVRSVTPVPEVKGRLVRMTYERNGADLAWLDRDDDNKTFAIALRTIPGDDTGVAHIIEHSVLCGSEKYPVKEPFVELRKSSFATYINAWTGSDFTAYPVCSRNDADFMNLMDVYLDAVFHPLSVKSPLAFRQEGWHYELKDGELVRNGVVLNEMRGSYGSPDRLAWHMLGRMLFPGNCYGLESGGDPAHIHELTWEKYRDFYRRHYHPSNVRIFLDGRIDLAATLARLDAVLSAYPRAEMSSPNPVQEPVRAEKTAEYEIGAEESAADKTLYLEGWVYGTFRDRETQAGLDVLTDALADSNEAPLKKALLSRGLCENVSFAVDCDEQISLCLRVKNVKDGKTNEVRRVVRETLESIARDGVDKARLDALIDRREFEYREMDYGGFPRGLMLFRRVLRQWLYGGDPADALCSGRIYSGLRAKAKTGWFEDLLRRAVVDNPHHAMLTMVPSKALGEERRRAEKAELAAIQAKWTPEEREQVMAECRALDEFQKKVDSPEDLAKLPRLSLKDIPEDGPVPECSETPVGGVRVIRAKTAANGIAYLKLYFELAGCSGEDLSDASVLSDVLGDLPTAKRGVIELKNALDAGLGGFQASTCSFAKPGDAKHAKAYFVVSVSALDTKLGEIARLVPEVLLESSFADANLVGDVVKQRRRRIEASMMGIGGSGFAARRAFASQSVQGAMDEHFGGIAFLRRLQRVDDEFAAGGSAYCRRLEALSRRVFVRAGLTACLSDNVPAEWLGGLFGRFPEGVKAEPSRIEAFVPAREGFRTAGKVGAAAKASFPNAYSGSGCVASKMLALSYLWNEIRVQGGAYGGGFFVRPGGGARYSSWNDPKPARSLGVYDGSGDALRRLVQDAPSIDNYIISAVSDTEPYLTPSVETSRAAALVLSGRTPDDLRRVRREMLRTTKGDIMRFADVLDSITNSASICVVGGAAQIEACSNVLDRVEPVARDCRMSAKAPGAAGNAASGVPPASDALGGMGNVSLKGHLGRRLDAMVERHVAARDVDYITAPFLEKTEAKRGWQTEFWGKWMHAAVPYLWKLEAEGAKGKVAEELHARIERGIDRILASQEPGGYIGNYPDELRCGEGWDVWGMKYTLMGLLHYFDYVETMEGRGKREKGNRKGNGERAQRALEAAKKLCDYVIGEIGPNGRRGRELWQTGNWSGYASSSILEPVVWLYRRTGEKRYLDFAGYIVRGMTKPESGPRLVDLALNGVSVADRNGYGNVPDAYGGYVAKHNRWKAYEMMSCYQGLLDYAEVSSGGVGGGPQPSSAEGAQERVPPGDIIRAAVMTAEDIVREEINMAGGAASSEAWFHGARKQHLPYVHLQETCVTITWMRLCEKLLDVTGDPKWADQIERTFYNAYLAAMKADGSEFAAYTPLSGGRWHGMDHCFMHTDCCTANGPRGFLCFLKKLFRVNGGAAEFNFYGSALVKGELPDGRKVAFDMYSRYPRTDFVRIVSHSSGSFPVKLRIPSWSESTVVKLNGKALGGVKPGGYFTVGRDWELGDVLEVRFDMPVVAHELGHHIAFTRGPILLARDSRFADGDMTEPFRRGSVADGQRMQSFAAVRAPSDGMWMAFSAALPIGSHTENPEAQNPTMVSFCDYASAGNAWERSCYYRTWFPVERGPNE